jgi:hypothetical protein
MLKKLVSLLFFVLATSAFAQSPYGRVLTLDTSGTQQWIDIMTVLSNYPTYHPSTPPTVWLTNGNLLSGGKFLGSTNNQPLIFKTNNTEQMRITPTGQIGIGTNSPDPSAILDIVSNSKGILIPRLNTLQRNAIVSPATGLLIFNTSTNTFDYYDGGGWQTIITTTSTVPFNLIDFGTNTSANMVVGAGANFTTNDNAFTIQDDGNSSKKAQFEASGISPSTTRTYTLPDANGTLALLNIPQTFLGTQTFNDISVTGNTALGFTNTNTLTIYATSTFVSAVNFPVTTVTTNTTLNDTYFLVLVNANGGAVTITLPSASSNIGRMYVIMKIDGSVNNVTIQRSGSDNINGVTSLTIGSQWGKYTLMSGGTQWVAWQ